MVLILEEKSVVVEPFADDVVLIAQSAKKFRKKN
jgi:hypothetical protein